jgi:microcystin-dependent protein
MATYNNLTSITHEIESIKPRIDLLSLAMFYSQAVIGDYKFSARTDDYLGWLICDGRTLERDEYPALFEVVGTSFGNTTSTNFKLPDLRGRVVGGIGNGVNLSARELGDAVGAERHILSVGEMPSHNHGGSTSTAGNHNHGGNTSTNGSHTHTHNANGGSVGLAFKNGVSTPSGLDNDGNELNLANTGTLVIDNAGVHAHTISTDGNHQHTISYEGGGQSHENMQPTLFIGNMMIFAGVISNTPE